MYVFHATLHARSPEVTAGVAVELRGTPTRTLVAPPAALAYPFGVTFEEAVAALERIERMFVEPDGSLVWVSSVHSVDSEKSRWQIDGNLFDRNGRLLLVDLKGSCANPDFDALLSCFGWPATPVMFELAREAVFLGETEFRDYASRSVAMHLPQPRRQP